MKTARSGCPSSGNCARSPTRGRTQSRGAPGKRYLGLIAQEVKAVIDIHPDMPNGQHLWSVQDDGTQAVAPGELILILVNAVKQLAAEVAGLKANRET